MKKVWAAYILPAAAGLSAACVCFVSGLWWAGLSAAAVLAWWTLYFAGLRYRCGKETLIIESGVVFRRERRLPRKGVLWVGSLAIGRKRAVTLLSVIHTASGRIIVFAEVHQVPL